MKQKQRLTAGKIGNSKRVVSLQGMWLLYNYENLVDYFWTRKSAIQHANYMSEGTFGDKVSDLPEHYQIIRGDIEIVLRNNE